jgi:hypothetical protein
MDWALSYGWTDPVVGAEQTSRLVGWGFLAWAAGAALVLLLATLAKSRLARRHFWCEQAGREVDVELEEHGAPGLRRFIAVRRCSAFEPSTAVRCRRSCLRRGAAVEAPVRPQSPPQSPPQSQMSD